MQWHMPMGYKIVDGKILISEKCKKVVEQIFRDYDSGESATHIGKRLTDLGIKNAQDRVSWSHAAIGRILENQNYLGNEYYPPIIDKELFERVQKRRERVCAGLGRGKYRPDARERNLFKGMLICAECGEPYTHIQPHKNSRYGIPKWKCKNYVYRKQLSCAGGVLSDRQIMEVCDCAITKLIKDRKLIYQSTEIEGQSNRRYQAVRGTIEAQKDIPTANNMELLYEQASERYQTLKVEDQEYKMEEMIEFLREMEEEERFPEESYQKLIKQIIVYKNNSVRVIFHNGSSTKIGCGEDISV